MPIKYVSRDISIDIKTNYKLYGHDSIPGVDNFISVFRSVQTGSGAHPASYALSTMGKRILSESSSVAGTVNYMKIANKCTKDP
jgi:hypothetical protein